MVLETTVNAVETATLVSQISYIAIILLIGLLTAIVAKRLRLPDILLLIIVGILLGNFVRFEKMGLSLSNEFVAGLGIFALILIVFESTAQIRFKELDQTANDSLRVTLISIAITALGMTLASWALLFQFSIQHIFIAVIFGTLMAGTAPDVLLSLIGKTKNKILRILEMESILNTPFTVLLPLLIISITQEFQGGVISGFIVKLLISITSGLGAGLLVGLIVFKAMRNKYSELYSPIAVITAAIVSYALAEQIGGNGIIAVTTLGIFFGNLDIKQKVALLQFESVLAMLLRVLIFVLIGVIIIMPADILIYVQTLFIYLCYIGFRFMAVHLAEKKFSWQQKLFMSLSASKGLPVTIVTFILATVIGGFEQILTPILVFVIISLVTASLVTRFGMGLLGDTVKQARE